MNTEINMAEVAHTARACSSRMLHPNGSGVESSRAKRRHRIEVMRKNSGLVVVDGEMLALGHDDGGERSKPEGSAVVGFLVPAACFSWAPGEGAAGLVIRESLPRFVPPAPPLDQMLRLPVLRRFPEPPVGAVAVAGRQRQMEDAVAIKTFLCSPLINRSRPVHYFGVFDGHGGSHFALMCKERLHAILKDELMSAAAVRQNQIRGKARPPLPPPGLITEESALQEVWRILISRVFAMTEMVAVHTCTCGSVGFQCKCQPSEVSFSGTTAAVVVLTDKHIVAGNCGDSRAVLYRGGRIIPLTFDHKPNRADEKARIEASGGRVINSDIARVQGILAMSRAIGDTYLKPYVISEPEVTFTRRDEEDEFLILASDGLWDVIPTDMAGRVARECLKESVAAAAAAGDHNSNPDLNFAPPEDEGSSSFPSASASAASLLTRLALARRSGDNISVVVVDLKRDISGDI